jgi:hypothetical protein
MPIAPQRPAGRELGAPPAHNGPAFWIKVSAREDGSFAIMNGRNGFSKTYGPRDDALTVSRGSDPVHEGARPER